MVVVATSTTSQARSTCRTTRVPHRESTALRVFVDRTGAGVVRLWNAANGHAVAALREHVGPVLALSWSPDGLRLASCGHDGRIRVWALWATKPTTKPAAAAAAGADTPQHEQDTASSEVASEIGSDAGPDVQVLYGHSSGARDLVWSPCGTMLASASDDKTVCLSLSRTP